MFTSVRLESCVRRGIKPRKTYLPHDVDTKIHSNTNRKVAMRSQLREMRDKETGKNRTLVAFADVLKKVGIEMEYLKH